MIVDAYEPGDINPRVLVWLRMSGLDRSTIERDADGNLKMCCVVGGPSDGAEVPWTAVYIAWSNRMWREWAASVGHTTSTCGSEPHRCALLDGYTPADYDTWLAALVSP